MKIEYLGKKLVKPNEALGQYKGKYFHTVEVYHPNPTGVTGPDVLWMVDKAIEMDKWVQETLGYPAYSLLPSDNGVWFKFKTKEDAMRFKLQFS